MGVVRSGRLGGLWACLQPLQPASFGHLKDLHRGRLARHQGRADLCNAAGGLRCCKSRLKVWQQHAGQAACSFCPVPQVTRDGQRWPEGEAAKTASLQAWGESEATADGATRDVPLSQRALQRMRMQCASPRLAACAEPIAQRARVTPAVEVAQSPFGLSPYFGHTAMHLGRGLRFLRCFCRSSGDYRAWESGRCLDEQPPQ